MKLVIRERESQETAELWDLALEITSSRLLYVEVRAALAAADRARRRRRANERVGELLDVVDFLEFDEEVALAAADVAEVHRLRANDAIHLASALDVADPELVILAWDADLRRAARDAGLTTAP